MYVYETYLHPPLHPWLFGTELASSVLFSFHFLVTLYSAEARLSYLASFPALVDVATIVPVFITFFGGDNSPVFGFLRFGRIMKLLKVLRLLRVFRSIGLMDIGGGGTTRRTRWRSSPSRSSSPS